MNEGLENLKETEKKDAIINFIIGWLNSNIDEYTNEISNSPEIENKNAIARDSQDLKEKIELALDKTTTLKDIENGDF